MTPRLVVFTDLDGTLLDHETYDCTPARPALAALAARGVPVVPCTSKTRAEVEALRRVLGLRDPFIVENGGAVFVPPGTTPRAPAGGARRDGYDVIALGMPYPRLTAMLDEAAAETGVAARGFHRMTADEVAGRTGLPPFAASLASQREYGEPFVVEDESPGAVDRLTAAIERRGGRVTRGGRFFHVTGGNDKGAAARALTALYAAGGPVRTAALGDAPNDLPLLEAVDVPIVVRSPRAEEVASRLPAARVTERPGPAGWNDAVLRLIDEIFP